MSVVLITGAAGLIGSEAATHFAELGYTVVGVDNDMRKQFFGDEASTAWNRETLERTLGALQERLHEKFGIDHVTLQPETGTRPLVRHAARAR